MKAGLAQPRAILCVSLCWILVADISIAQEAVSSARNIKGDEAARSLVNAAKDDGITFPIVFTTELFGDLSGGVERTAIWESLLKAGVNIDFEKAIGLKGLTFSINTLYAQGSSLTSKAVHDFSTLSNIDAYDSLRLYEAWLQQEFSEGRFTIQIGQILVDADFFKSEYGELFINSSFGALSTVSKNLNAPIFPVAAPGLVLRVAPTASFYAETAAFSGDVGEPSTTNKHNTLLRFRDDKGSLMFLEIGWKLNPREDRPASPNPSDVELDSTDSAPPTRSTVLSGTYKLGGYYNTGTLADSGKGSAHHGDYSIYFIADQEMWHAEGNADRTLSVFARITTAPNDRNTVSLYTDAGLNYKGVIPSRDKDVIGLGYSYTRLSNGLVIDSGRSIRSHHEAVLELTYQAVLGDHISLQPDVQCIFNPGAAEPAATAFVMGLRLNVKF